MYEINNNLHEKILMIWTFFSLSLSLVSFCWNEWPFLRVEIEKFDVAFFVERRRILSFSNIVLNLHSKRLIGCDKRIVTVYFCACYLSAIYLSTPNASYGMRAKWNKDTVDARMKKKTNKYLRKWMKKKHNVLFLQSYCETERLKTDVNTSEQRQQQQPQPNTKINKENC